MRKYKCVVTVWFGSGRSDTYHFFIEAEDNLTDAELKQRALTAMFQHEYLMCFYDGKLPYVINQGRVETYRLNSVEAVD